MNPDNRLDPLIGDLLEWITTQPRSYAEVMETWRTSCPKLPVWEEAETRSFVTREQVEGRGTSVSVTATGQAFLAKRRADAP